MKQLTEKWAHFVVILIVATVLVLAIIVCKQPRVLVTEDNPWYQSTK